MAEKKRLHHFLNDLLKLSCVKGFKHFATHMRGREEMICSVVNEPSMPIIQSATNSPAVSFGHHQKREAFPMSQKQQRRLSGYGFINVGLPPASPSENEEVDESQTMFLIAGYSRYNRPYVWVRTNHERLVRLASEEEKDYPLMLQTTSQWPEKDVKVWDVLTELVEVCASPCPPNPFAVDLDYFHSLSLQERALASAAMISFLQKVIASGHHSYNRRIVSDIGKVGQLHFAVMQRLLQEGIIKFPPSPSPAVSSQGSQLATARDTAPMKSQSTAHTSSAATAVTGPVPMSGTKVPPAISSVTGPVPMSGTKVPPRVISSVTPGQSTYSGVPQTHSSVVTRPMFTPPQQPTPAQYAPPQPQTRFQQTQAPPTSTGSQFYSRRMAGSYNY